MPEITQMVAVGKWAERATLDYKPVNARLSNGRRYGSFGVPISSPGDPAEIRRPYKIEDLGSVVYVMYDDDSYGDVPIFRALEV